MTGQRTPKRHWQSLLSGHACFQRLAFNLRGWTTDHGLRLQTPNCLSPVFYASKIPTGSRTRCWEAVEKGPKVPDAHCCLYRTASYFWAAPCSPAHQSAGNYSFTSCGHGNNRVSDLLLDNILWPD